MKLLTDDGRRRTTEPAYTISSPGAFGSGELKKKEVQLSTPDKVGGRRLGCILTKFKFYFDAWSSVMANENIAVHNFSATLG